MARIRSIKPEFFTSISIADLSRDARLMFVGMWTHVDDDGRCVDEPRLIKAALFPLDDDLTAYEIHCLMSELEERGRIIRYSVEGRGYVQIVGFNEHQKIDRHTPSKHPPAPLCESSSTTRRAIDEAATTTRPLIGSDRIGSDRDLDDSLTTWTVDNDPRFDHVVTQIVDIRAQRTKPRSPKAWAAKVRASVAVDERDRIIDLLRDWPDAPYDVIAAAVEGDSSSLRYYPKASTA